MSLQPTSNVSMPNTGDISSEWRTLVVDKLSGLEAAFTRLAEQITDIRVAAITSKHLEAIEDKIKLANSDKEKLALELVSYKLERRLEDGKTQSRIDALEALKIKAFAIFGTINALLVVIWALYTKTAIKL